MEKMEKQMRWLGRKRVGQEKERGLAGWGGGGGGGINEKVLGVARERGKLSKREEKDRREVKNVARTEI